MKPLIVGGCPRCKGTLAQEQDGLTRDEKRGIWYVEFKCVECSRSYYRQTKSLKNVKLRHYN